MGGNSTRDMVVNAVLIGLVFGGLIYWQTRDLVQVVPAAAIMAAALYLGSLASNRIARRIGQRVARREAVDHEPVEATTERPEHVQRRRAKRRPRGRQQH
jgi:membrane protein DedA with SNARE-associated domain